MAWLLSACEFSEWGSSVDELGYYLTLCPQSINIFSTVFIIYWTGSVHSLHHYNLCLGSSSKSMLCIGWGGTETLLRGAKECLRLDCANLSTPSPPCIRAACAQALFGQHCGAVVPRHLSSVNLGKETVAHTAEWRWLIMQDKCN